MNLNIEIYKEKDFYCAWITDDCGGSGIEVKAKTYKEFASKIGPYIADYAFREKY